MKTDLHTLSIFVKTLPEAWHDCIYHLMSDESRDFSHVYQIDQGSFAGQKRLEFDYITVRVEYPGSRPLVPDTPQGIPPVSTMEYVESYLPYLMTSVKKSGEEYTYGEYLEPQIAKVIEKYKSGPGNNQCYMTVGGKESIDQKDPPCLRGIDTRIIDGRLHFIVYFRSWDLWAGFPSNLAAIQLLKEYMASEMHLEDGNIVAASKGLHLYDQVWDLAKKVVFR